MTWFTGAMVYVIIWWVVLFTVLPWGVRAPDEPEPGHVPSAPVKPRLLLKFAITTGIASVLFVIVYFVIDSDLISFREMGPG